MKIAFTVCNRHHLSHALVLAHSLRQHNPDRRFFLGWVDRMQLPNLPNWISVIPVESLEMADWISMEQRYFDFELVAGCKPFFARYLLTTFPDCEELLFLSPTTQVFDLLDKVANSSDFLQLNPQRLRPIGDFGGRRMGRYQLDDKRILNTGMYQAGSWIMHPDGQEKAMLSWWCDRMTDRGLLDLCEGMCLDQLWLNYLPIYHERVETIRNPGWQYGLPAVPGSKFTFIQGQYFVDNSPLVSLDFAGIETHHPLLSDYVDLVDGKPLWTDLRHSYRNSLQEYDFSFDIAISTYGNPTIVKSQRNYRRRAVRFLKNLIDGIEHFDWTYN
ncbi:hypothetical protein [Persicitalea sp.]|uniref:hypothetical protein n=1 Tax=Persicitalea sp. TaxID=3100273 RepID=UPI003592E93F